jgi:nucleoside-diphosphate-sugar epimerase
LDISFFPFTVRQSTDLVLMGAEVPISAHASSLFSDAIDAYERVLILGASGWFGRTALSMMGRRAQNALLIGQSERHIKINGSPIFIREWSEGFLEEFGPDLVLDFAFLTKDKILPLGLEEFSRQNAMLSERLVSIASFPSVKKIVTVSSGAAIHKNAIQSEWDSDSYGSQKARNEDVLRELAITAGKEVTVARAWSVSGGHLQAPEKYAFSDFINRALREGRIQVTAPHRVFRRYCAVEEFLAVALLAPTEKRHTEFDSGGALVELEDLAKLIAAEIGGVSLEFAYPDRTGPVPDDYFSDGEDWDRLCKEFGLTPLDIVSQIRNVRNALA